MTELTLSNLAFLQSKAAAVIAERLNVRKTTKEETERRGQSPTDGQDNRCEDRRVQTLHSPMFIKPEQITVKMYRHYIFRTSDIQSDTISEGVLWNLASRP